MPSLELTSVLFTVLCGNERGSWLNPALVNSLLALPNDPRFAVTVSLKPDVFPVDRARNEVCILARDLEHEWLVMCDNDQTLPQRPNDLLSILSSAPPEADVIGFMCGTILNSKVRMNAHINEWSDDEFVKADHVGTGLIALRSSVWKKLPKGPWFVTTFNDDELHSVDRGEDVYFNDLCNAAGLKTFVPRVCYGHLKTFDLTPQAIQNSFKIPAAHHSAGASHVSLK